MVTKTRGIQTATAFLFLYKLRKRLHDVRMVRWAERGQKKVINIKEMLRVRTSYWKGWWEVRIADRRLAERTNLDECPWSNVGRCGLIFQKVADSGKNGEDDNKKWEWYQSGTGRHKEALSSCLGRRMTRASSEGCPDRNRLSVRGSAYQWCCANPWQKEGKGYQGIPTLVRSGQLPPMAGGLD